MVTAPVAGQTPTPTETQKTFACTRTAAVVGDGFTLDCDVVDAGTSDTVSAEVTIRNVRRYKSSIDVAHWLYFDIVAGIDYTSWRLPIKLHYADGTYMECSEPVSDMTADQVEEGLIIPDVCGVDVEWYAAEFTAPGYFECSGCGVYYLGADASVLGDEQGRRVRGFRTALEVLLKVAGITVPSKGLDGDLHWHGLRHECGSRLAERGSPVV